MKKDIKVTNTDNLKKFIELAETLGFNRYPEIDKLRLDPAGLHLLIMQLADHQGFANRDIVHHRVKVMAKVYGEKDEPLEFFLDLRAQDWDRLIDVESMNLALQEMQQK
jgi:hypothetical protein